MSVDRYSDCVFAPADLAEAPDLPLALKKEILYLDARLGTLDHWTLLGVPWNAPPAAVRAAYVERAKVFHPDRHAGRPLGSYLGRIERIFRALTAARDALCDEVTRAAYVRQTAPPEDFARLETRRIQDEARAQERRARLARSNPIVARATRLQELLARGKQAMAAGRHAQAMNDFLTVAGLDPRNLEARALAEEARQRSGVDRARAVHDKALEIAALGNASAALAMLREAVDAEPANASHAAAGVRIALERGMAAEARWFAEQAVRAAPRDAQAFATLAQVLDALGETEPARRAVQRALELDPGLAPAKALARKLRWSLFR